MRVRGGGIRNGWRGCISEEKRQIFFSFRISVVGIFLHA